MRTYHPARREATLAELAGATPNQRARRMVFASVNERNRRLEEQRRESSAVPATSSSKESSDAFTRPAGLPSRSRSWSRVADRSSDARLLCNQTSHDVDALAAVQRDRCRTRLSGLAVTSGRFKTMPGRVKLHRRHELHVWSSYAIHVFHA